MLVGGGKQEANLRAQAASWAWTNGSSSPA